MGIGRPSSRRSKASRDAGLRLEPLESRHLLAAPLERTSSFEIDGRHSVPFALFSAPTPGSVDVKITWTGGSGVLTAELFGRRRPELADPAAPYATATGVSPLSLSYVVTSEDIDRGVGWRLVVRDTTGAADADGSVTVIVPDDPTTTAVFERERIELESGDIWPSSTLHTEFVSALAAAPGEGLHGIITFNGACSCYDTFALQQRGLVKQSYLNGNHFYGFVPKNIDLSDPAIAGLIRHFTPLAPEDKIDPHLLVGDFAEYDVIVDGEHVGPDFLIDGQPIERTNDVLNADGTLNLGVAFAPDILEDRIVEILSAVGAEFEDDYDEAWVVTLDPDQLPELASYNEVLWIEAGEGPFLPDVAATRADMNANAAHNIPLDASGNPTIGGDGFPIYNGFSGRGVIVGIDDNGINDHLDLDSYEPSGHLGSSRQGGHGTHVAGIVGASGFQSDKLDDQGNPNPGGPFQFRGIAPNARLYDDRNYIRKRVVEAAIDYGLDVINNSESKGRRGQYNRRSASIDKIVRGDAKLAIRRGQDIPGRPWVGSAGNNGGNNAQYGTLNGYFSLGNQSKNAILVGNWFRGAGKLAGSSSVGPAFDGRLKPDVVTHGTNVTSTATDVNEVQTVVFSARPSTGSFVLRLPVAGTSGMTVSTAPISHDASADEVRDAIEAALPGSLGAGEVAVSRHLFDSDAPSTNDIRIAFRGGLAHTNVPQLAAASFAADPLDVTVSAGTQRQGSSSNGYRVMSGTSMSSPAVAGGLALMLEAWQRTYAEPMGTDIDSNPPLPSTLRALLIQTAQDVVDTSNEDANGNRALDGNEDRNCNGILNLGEDANMNGMLDRGEDTDGDCALDLGVKDITLNDVDFDSDPTNGNDHIGFATATPGPDYATGWGRVDIDAAIDMLVESQEVEGRPQPKRIVQSTIQQFGVVEYEFVVTDPTDPIKVTLAWDDAAHSPVGEKRSRKLVNDLDLELEAPDGTIFLPWQLGHRVFLGNVDVTREHSGVVSPGANIDVVVPIKPPIGTPRLDGNDDNIPFCAINGTPDPTCPTRTGRNISLDDIWVARRGRDHLNNVEQVSIEATELTPAMVGHWKARVTGFNVRNGPRQSFSLVGMPYPELPDIVALATSKAPLALDVPIDVTWEARNVGPVPTPAGVPIQYEVFLSRDIHWDPSDDSDPVNDVLLSDAMYAPLSRLFAAGSALDTAVRTSRFTISQDSINRLYEAPPGTDVPFEQAVADDVFILVRVDSTAVVLEHNEANIAPLQLARPTDVVLLLDRSGSMNGDVIMSSGERDKLDLLKDAASLLLDVMRRDAGDQLSVIPFAGDAIGIFGVDGALTPLVTGNVEDVRLVIGGIDAGGETDIRTALETALMRFPALPAGDTSADRRRVVIFFSDGKKTDGGDPADPMFLDAFGEQDVHIYSVGFGNRGRGGRSGIDAELLQTLAAAGSGGFSHVTDIDGELKKFFVQAVAAAIGDEVIIDPVNFVLPGEESVVPVNIGTAESIVTFILTWDNPDAIAALSLRTPSGQVIDQSNFERFAGRITRRVAATHEIFEVRLPLDSGADIDHGGTWQMVAANTGTVGVELATSAIASSTVRFHGPQPEPPTDHFSPGAAIPLTAGLFDDDQAPLSRAAITVFPTVPSASMADLLAAIELTPEELATIPSVVDDEMIGDQQRRYQALQARVGFDPISYIPARQFQLGETMPGQYAGSFTDTDFDGVYTFRVGVYGLAENCELVQREWTTSAAVAPRVDPARTEIVVETPTPGSGELVVTTTPVTIGGGFFGPGLLADVFMDIPGANPLDDVTDLGDGSYRRRFAIANFPSATVNVSIAGTPLAPRKFDTAAPTPVGISPAGGTNDAPTLIRIGAGPNANLGGVAGVMLVSPEAVVSLSNFQLDQVSNSIIALVPANLTPSTYRVHLRTQAGTSLTTSAATFEVVDHPNGSPANPAPARRLESAVAAMLATQDPFEQKMRLGRLLRDLRRVPLSDRYDADTRSAAALETARLLASDNFEFVELVDVPHLTAAVDRAVIDTTTLPAPPCVVTNTLDSGPGSLREAINCANVSALPGGAAIVFQIPTDPNVDVDSSLAGGDAEPDVYVISPLTELPALENEHGWGINLDARTQTSFGGDTNPFGPEIVLRGNNLEAPALTIASNQNRVSGFAVAGFGEPVSGGSLTPAIVVLGNENWIAGNYLGTDAAGDQMARDSLMIGVSVSGHFNIIGTNGDGVGDAAERNLLSATSQGLSLLGDGNIVAGNLVGTDRTGTKAAGMSAANTFGGIDVEGDNNRVGTNGDGVADVQERNVISGNWMDGVTLFGDHNVVAGNYIGTDITGTIAIPNGHSVSDEDAGVGILGGSFNRVGSDRDGIRDSVERNLISGNRDHGVLIESFFGEAKGNVVAQNYIGTDRTGLQALGNQSDGVHIFRSSANFLHLNLISANGGSGVRIEGIEATDNVLLGNDIGLDQPRTGALGNGAAGVHIESAPGNLVDANRIAGNIGDGVRIQGPAAGGNILTFNFMGHTFGNGLAGVRVDNAPDNVVGLPAPSTALRRNAIRGNGGPGVHISGAGATGNRLLGNDIEDNAGDGVLISDGAHANFIGTDSDGADDAFEFNVLARNGLHGVEIASAHQNVVAGNRFWYDDFDYGSFGNLGHGVMIHAGATFNRIGTDADGASDEAERNIISANILSGVHIEGAGTERNVVAGNYIGADAAGTAGLSNGGNGVTIIDLAAENMIGGATPSARNIISANGNEGVRIQDGATRNRVEGNYIGTDVTGARPLGNASDGVAIVEAHGNTVGGTAGGAGNLISANALTGVAIQGVAATGNVVAGNLIGTDVSGRERLGNFGYGVSINVASQNTIGGATDGARNVISDNRGGVFIGSDVLAGSADGNRVLGNFIGTDVTGAAPLGNAQSGIEIANRARGNVVGTNGDGMTDLLERNIISANNANGIEIHGPDAIGNVVAGNYIGTAANGLTILSNAQIGVHIRSGASGNRIGTDGNGLGDNDEGNVISGNLGHGVHISGVETNDNIVAGNLIGLARNGNAPVPNGDNGVNVSNHAARRNRIGTDGSDDPHNAAERNVIAANLGDGVHLHGPGDTVVAGNIIGADASGGIPRGNGRDGVVIDDGATRTRLGTNADGIADLLERNLIADSVLNGVYITDPGTSENVVAGNWIGLKSDGVDFLPNQLHGIYIHGDAAGNRIGANGNDVANDSIEGNIIAGNLGDGVRVVVAGTINNSIRGNSIHSNALLGIDLGGDGVTENDPQDPDTGPNLLQNFPLLSAARVAGAGDSTRVRGTLNSLPETTFTVDVYANTDADVSGYGEGQRWLGTIEVTTDEAGIAPIDHVLPAATSPGEFIVATATDPQGNTSEFSPIAIRSTDHDLNSDGRVDGGDVAAQLTGFGANSGALPDEGDLDFDGDIDLFDLIVLQASLVPPGAPAPAAPAVAIQVANNREKTLESKSVDFIIADWKSPPSTSTSTARLRVRVSPDRTKVRPTDPMDPSLGGLVPTSETDKPSPILRARRIPQASTRRGAR
jgi:hypothetical protein